jgi:hypothetical protein
MSNFKLITIYYQEDGMGDPERPERVQTKKAISCSLYNYSMNKENHTSCSSNATRTLGKYHGERTKNCLAD